VDADDNRLRSALREVFHDRVQASMDRALIAAQGKALTLLIAVLQRNGIVSFEEFGDLLGAFSVVVAEDNEER
jgi:hypothetical protein